MSRRAGAEDLLVLARQCKLSEEDERRFQTALQSSRELEYLYDAGLHFDHEAGVRSGDELRLGRLVERALQQIDDGRGPGEDVTAPPLPTRRATRWYRPSSALRYFAASMGLGMLLCVTLASAWAYVEKRVAARHALEVQNARRASPGAVARTKLTPQAPAALPASPPPELAPSAFAAAVEVPSPIAPIAPRKAATEHEPSESELFARANEARRRGDIEEAIALYERLARVYPGSVEAEDAKILRGNLLLIQRSPRAALRQFEDYRAGALSLEALWGRAQALRKLESPEEREVLLELLREHPSSPYADAARKRLGELAR